MGALTILATAACEQTPTAPTSHIAAAPQIRHSVAPGTLAIYRDKTAWLAAVSAAGMTASEYDYTGLTLGRITTRSMDYGPFRIAVDLLSSGSSFNPGIDVIADANCSLGAGDCPRMLFNMMDPSQPQTTPPFDQPYVDSLVMPNPIGAWGADFAQTGTSGGSTTSIGVTSIHIGGVNFALTDSLVNGFGFIGFIVGSPSNTITFTFAKSGSLVNDIIEVYRPAFANASSGGGGGGPTPSQMITTLTTYVDGAGLAKAITMKLDGYLGKASAAVSANNTAAACTSMQDVIDYTNKQGARKIPTSVSTEIVSEANAIRTAIGC